MVFPSCLPKPALLLFALNSLAGLVERTYRERRIRGLIPACAVEIFSRSSNTNDVKTGTPVATLPGAWCYRDSSWTVGPVSVYCEWVR